MKKSNMKILTIASSIMIVLLITLFCITRSTTVVGANITKISTDSQRIQQLEQQVKVLENKISTLETMVNGILVMSTSSVTTPTPTLKDNKDIKVNTPQPTKKSNEIITVITAKPEDNKIIEKTVKATDTKKINVSTTITEKSGLTADQIDQLLTYVLTVKYDKKDSKLLGQGKVLYEMEQANDVNVFYALAVATFETGWGRQGVARQNNLFAFANNSGNGYRIYASPADSIKNFGAHTRNFYFNKKSLTTVSEIAPVYCPPNSSKWIYQVNWLINFYAKTAKSILQK